jgi:hypothetical protein
LRWPTRCYPHGVIRFSAGDETWLRSISNSQGVVIDQSGTAVRDLTEARDHAARVAQSSIMALSPEDWRD